MNFIGLVALNVVVGMNGAFSITSVFSGNFTNGVWTGMITALQPGLNVVLSFDDGGGCTGSSNLFEVIVLNDIVVIVKDVSYLVVFGVNVTYMLTITNNG